MQIIFCIKKYHNNGVELKPKIIFDKIRYDYYKNPYNITECLICLNNFKNNDKINVFNCGHIIYFTCMNETILKCPTCRIDLF